MSQAGATAENNRVGQRMIAGMSGIATAATAIPPGIGARLLSIGAGLARIAMVGVRLTVVGTAITAVIGGLTWIYNNGSNITSWFHGFAEELGLLEPVTKILTSLGDAIGWVVDKFEKLWSFFGKTGSNAEWRDSGREWGKWLRDNDLMNWILGEREQDPNPRKTTSLTKNRNWPQRQAAKMPLPEPSPFRAPQLAGATPQVNQADIQRLQSQAQAVTATVQDSMNQIRAIVAGVDLTAEGERIGNSLATGLRRSAGNVRAAAQESLSNNVRNAWRGAYSDGGR